MYICVYVYVYIYVHISILISTYIKGSNGWAISACILCLADRPGGDQRTVAEKCTRTLTHTRVQTPVCTPCARTGVHTAPVQMHNNARAHPPTSPGGQPHAARKLCLSSGARVIHMHTQLCTNYSWNTHLWPRTWTLFWRRLADANWGAKSSSRTVP